MAAKRIRCICGKVYSPDESKVCPSCGTEVRIESISIVAPTSAEPRPASSASSAAATQPVAGERPHGPKKIPWLWIGGAVWLTAVIAAVAVHLLKPDSKPIALVVAPGPAATIKKEATDAAARAEPAEKKDLPAPAADKPAVVKKEPAPSPSPAPSGGDGEPAPAPGPGPSDGAGKSGKQWIVQAKESEEAGGAALAEVLGKADEGDTILLKPGTYAGEFTVRANIRLVGEAGGAAFPLIKMASKRAVFEVKRPGATLENLKIVFASEGSTPGLKINPEANLIVAGCEIQATAGNCVMAMPTSSIAATKSVFTSRGSAAILLARAAGQFTGCTFSNSRTGLALAGESKADLNDCTFEKCGPKNGPQNGVRAEEGYAVSADGRSEAGVRLTDCKFTGNTGGILVVKGMTATLTKCAFSDNGISGDSELFTQGLFAIGSGGRAVLNGVTFKGDRQGLGVYSGGALEMTDCHLTNVGLKDCRKDIRSTADSIFVRGKGGIVRLKQCDIVDAPGEIAAYASDGGAIEAENCEIRNAGFFAVYAGTGRDEAPCRVMLKGGRIVNNRLGLKVATGGSGSVDGTEFRQNGTGIEISDAGTNMIVMRAVLAENRDMGLLVLSRAEASLRDCAIENNAAGGAQVGVTGKSEARADLTLDNCRIGSNTEFDVKAGTQSRITVKDCTWSGAGQRPKLNIEQKAIAQFDPPLGGLADNMSLPAKKSRQGSSDDSPARPSSPQRGNPPRTPPPTQDPVGQAIDAFNKLRRIIR